MVMVSSARCPASSLILLSSAARSWLPGWYCLTGSFTGTGVLETASITIAPGVRCHCCGYLYRRTILPGGSFRQVGQLLTGVPAELVAVGPVHVELGALVTRVGGWQCFDRAAHIGGRLGVVDERRNERSAEHTAELQSPRH